jgi:FkbM family methyltransferase
MNAYEARRAARARLSGSREVARGLAEQTTHRLVLRRRLPAPFGEVKIYASSEGGLRYLRPSLSGVDPTLLQLVADVVRPGHNVWDIGANLGLFSFAAAAASGPRGHVLAVEPDATLVELLRRTAASNGGHAQVDVMPVAVADELGVGRFNIARRNRSTSYLDGFGTSQTGGVRSTQLVPAVSLNWLAANFRRPDVIKIDVEGAELKVLDGGADVLRDTPALICEVAGHSAAAVAQLLISHGYTLYDGALPAGERIPVTAAPPTTLALHDSHPAARTYGPFR